MPVRRLLVCLLALVAALVGSTLPGSPAESQEIERQTMSFQDVAEIDELTNDHARIFRLYWVYFDRQPDPEGALFWIDRFERCQSLRSIAEFFGVSPEFQATYGDLATEQFVDLVYRNSLDRAAEPGGRAYWIGELRSGRIDRVQMMLHFAHSPEFVGNHPLPSDRVPGRGCRGAGPSTSDRARSFSIQPWPVFATIGGVALHQPSAATELVGYHESNHDGAQNLQPVTGGTRSLTMASRNRDTVARGAADMASHPLVEVRAPVTGTVVRAGGYTLYCRYSDDYVVIEPDERPGWEVKVLHISGVSVRAGDRVVAGETVLAPRPNQLPFSSQIDTHTGQPAWPHVHIEVVDPSIPDRPSPGGGC